MVDTVTVRAGSAFRCEIDLRNLQSMTQTNWRRICRMMHNYEWLNESALAVLRKEFPLRIESAKTAYLEAEETYSEKYVPPQTIRSMPLSYRRQNARIRETLKAKKREYRRLTEFFEIFKEETD